MRSAYRLSLNTALTPITKGCVELTEEQENELKVRKELIDTWQTLRTFSIRTGLAIRTCERILVTMYNNGEVQIKRRRLDGHNKIHIFRPIITRTILGVHMPIDIPESEEV